ncbi:MAG: hypothetical protein JO227_16360 [Acetobacteraceae bacterium]|nr:hypothetical protein [Acetobacteraceae bacterium]
MPGSQNCEAVLHGLFRLRDGVTDDEFQIAFDAFVAHLAEAGYPSESRVMRRKPLPGFGKKLPDFTHYSAIMFADAEREQACYDYVANGAPEVHAIHRNMNRLVAPGAQFFVTIGCTRPGLKTHQRLVATPDPCPKVQTVCRRSRRRSDGFYIADT